MLHLPGLKRSKMAPTCAVASSVSGLKRPMMSSCCTASRGFPSAMNLPSCHSGKEGCSAAPCAKSPCETPLQGLSD